MLFSVNVLPVPEGMVKCLNTIFYEFIQGQKEYVKRSVIIGDYHQGGAKMIDTESLFQSIKAAWLVRFINASELETWNIFANHFLKRRRGDNFVLQC